MAHNAVISFEEERFVTPQAKTVLPETRWFTEARFGLFIHWGIYSVAARHEWVKKYEAISDAEYRPYFERFDPDLYDPRAWARMAKAAGMKYFVITTKHHDGFCLWDTQLTDYKATNTPAGRDLIAPMVEAFRAEGLRVGLYHSLLDWHHPEYTVDRNHPQSGDREFVAQARKRDMRKYREYLHGQVRELLTGYGKIDLLFFDFSWPQEPDEDGLRGKGKEDWDSERLLAMVRELQPGIIVNDRLDIPGDYVTPEQAQPRAPMQRDGKPVIWEACHTLNGSWGYHRDNLDWKSPAMLVEMLVDCVAKNGNLLLNVGPNARGEFDPRAMRTLAAIGEWMRLHGAAIHGCGASEFAAPSGCRLTQKGKRLYVHLFEWPMKHLHLDGLAGKVSFARLLNDGSEIRIPKDQPWGLAHHGGDAGVSGDTLLLELPIQRPEVLVPVIELSLR